MLRFPASVGAHIVKERWIRRASTSGVFLFLRSASFALHISIVEILLSYLVFGLVELSISEPYEVGNLSSQQRWIFKCARDSLLVYFERGWEISSLYHYLSGSSKGSAWVVINFFKRSIVRHGSTQVCLHWYLKLVDFMGCEQHVRYWFFDKVNVSTIPTNHFSFSHIRLES